MRPDQRNDGDGRAIASVDEYIAALASPQREIASTLRHVIKTGFPELTETIKWHVPFYVASKKNNLFSINAYSAHVNLYFYNGAELSDPLSLLEGSGKQVRHLSFHHPRDIDEAYISQLVAQSVHVAGTA